MLTVGVISALLHFLVLHPEPSLAGLPGRGQLAIGGVSRAADVWRSLAGNGTFSADRPDRHGSEEAAPLDRTELHQHPEPGAAASAAGRAAHCRLSAPGRWPHTNTHTRTL